jgi:hypothetical protein
MRNRVAIIALASALTTACVYAPGAFLRDAQRRRDRAAAASGCFELQLAWRVQDDLPADSPVLEFEVANRCQHPARLNLSSMPIVARYPDARLATLHPFDPRHELRTITLDPYRVESFEVQFDNPWFHDEQLPRGLCLDVRRFDEASPATEPSHFACLARNGRQVTLASVEQL